MLHPEIEGCRTYQIYVSDADHRLGDPSKAIAVHTVPEPTSVLPDDRFPECTILLTYRRLPARPGLVVIAATRAGVLEEFPNGRRKPAWLLLTPLAAIGDAIPAVGIGAAFTVLNPAFWLN